MTSRTSGKRTGGVAKRRQSGKGINPVGPTIDMEDAVPSFIDPDFDDLEGLEGELREQYGHLGSED